MSSPALDDLLDALGFDGSPLEIDLRAFHVPYDDRGRGGIESGIADAARRCERIAVSAPIGAGKTSAIRYALDDADNGLAPIWVSVSRDTEDVVTEPKAFLAHLDRGPAKRNLRTVLSIAHQALTDAIGGDRELIDADDVRAAAPKHLG